jgi:hypothetical protein
MTKPDELSMLATCSRNARGGPELRQSFIRGIKIGNDTLRQNQLLPWRDKDGELR